jgi:hypothetical protein
MQARTLVASSEPRLGCTRETVALGVLLMPRIPGLLVIALLLSAAAVSQTQQDFIKDADFTADYPMDRAGIFIQSPDWKDIKNQMPTKTKAAHGFAASLSYGLVPAKVVAEYEGEHGPAQASAGQPILCVCHILSLPGQPVIVRLRPKKGDRELDGGKMIVYPVVGGSKTADANKSDLIPVEIAHPDAQVWLVRSQVALGPGEYALMLGTQNVAIYPFSVAGDSPRAAK